MLCALGIKDKEENDNDNDASFVAWQKIPTITPTILISSKINGIEDNKNAYKSQSGCITIIFFEYMQKQVYLRRHFFYPRKGPRRKYRNN